MSVVCYNFFVLMYVCDVDCVFFFSSRRRHTRLVSDWSSDVCSSDLMPRVMTRSRSIKGEAVRLLGKVRRPNSSISEWCQSGLPSASKAARMPCVPCMKTRSEERRVGKEWRSRRQQDHVKNRGEC